MIHDVLSNHRQAHHEAISGYVLGDCKLAHMLYC